ncbi:VirD4-like conjugal transfer protein, CD1115 family [uncultured Clostridium sp.]|uniref:VirD4-like conjugal transfer protein, CD1115 family n=1 Tax=uncultured Clostridium sp. TaxID=59620 RepID=UPI00261E85B5|nr:type IV secretory system conjugative DNA transfer family protein [uncultured Clostridium sp.]
MDIQKNKISERIKELESRLLNVQREKAEKETMLGSKKLLNRNRGVILHTDLENKQSYVCPHVIHTLGLGPTGTGKSQMLVFPTMEMISRPAFPSAEQLRKNNALEEEIKLAENIQESMIVNDVKGELLANMYDVLKKRGYNIKVINLEEPYHSHAWNPFETIKQHYLEALKENPKNPDLSNTTNLANAFAHILNDDPNAKDKFWQDTAKNLTSGTILAMVEDLLFLNDETYFPTENNESNRVKTVDSFTPHVLVNTISNLASTPYDDKSKLLDYYFTSRSLGNLPKQKASAMTSAGENTKGSILSTALTNLDLFTDESIARLTSDNEINFEDLIKKPTAIFIVCPDDNPTRWALASIFVEQSYFTLSKLIKKKYKGKSPRRINYILDEFAQMPTIPDLDKKTSMSRSRNIRFSLFVQDLNQFNVKYGDYAPIIKNNCQNMIYIKTNDYPAVEETFKKLGNRTVVRRSVSSSLGDTKYQISESLEEEPLLHINELMELPFEKGVVMRLGRKPIHSDYYSAFRYFRYKDVNGEIKKGIKETDIESLIPCGKHSEINLNERVYYCNPIPTESGKFIFESVRISKQQEVLIENEREINELDSCDEFILQDFKNQEEQFEKEPIDIIREYLIRIGISEDYLKFLERWRDDRTVLSHFQECMKNNEKTISEWNSLLMSNNPLNDNMYDDM